MGCLLDTIHILYYRCLSSGWYTNFMLDKIEGICTPDQKDHFKCPQGTTNFAASIIWGLVGPKRLISVGKIYSGFLHFFWIGALWTILVWALQKCFPRNTYPSKSTWLCFSEHWVTIGNMSELCISVCCWISLQLHD